MLCQNCKINDSTIHLYTNVNGHQQQVDLCQNCYQIMKTDPNNSLLAGLNQQNRGGRDPFEDFFNQLGNFQAPQEPQTPPTQSGEAMVVEMAMVLMETVVLQDPTDPKPNNNQRAF